MSKDANDFVLILRPLDKPVPNIIRLRRLLKALGRAYGLRCVSVTEKYPKSPKSA